LLLNTGIEFSFPGSARMSFASSTVFAGKGFISPAKTNWATQKVCKIAIVSALPGEVIQLLP
jgi:hypothetical protein